VDNAANAHILLAKALLNMTLMSKVEGEAFHITRWERHLFGTSQVLHGRLRAMMVMVKNHELCLQAWPCC